MDFYANKVDAERAVLISVDTGEFDVASSLLELDSPLSSFTDLQRVLYQEEQAAYQQAISQNMR